MREGTKSEEKKEWWKEGKKWRKEVKDGNQGREEGTKSREEVREGSQGRKIGWKEWSKEERKEGRKGMTWVKVIRERMSWLKPRWDDGEMKRSRIWEVIKLSTLNESIQWDALYKKRWMDENKCTSKISKVNK